MTTQDATTQQQQQQEAPSDMLLELYRNRDIHSYYFVEGGVGGRDSGDRYTLQQWGTPYFVRNRFGEVDMYTVNSADGGLSMIGGIVGPETISYSWMGTVIGRHVMLLEDMGGGVIILPTM